MKIDYLQNVDSVMLEHALGVAPIEAIVFAVEFEVTKYYPAVTSGSPDNWCPEEGGELEITGIVPKKVLLADSTYCTITPAMLSTVNELKVLTDDDEKLLAHCQACWEHWLGEEAQHRAIALNDLRHDFYD